MARLPSVKTTISLFLLAIMPASAALADTPWEQATKNGEESRRALLGCWRYLHGWLQHADRTSGLIPRNLGKDAYWNAKDSAADNYPFMVLSAYYTDRPLYDGVMHDMLRAERRLTDRAGHLPDDFLFSTQSFRPRTPKLAELIFGASEYAKDGLMPVTELLGPTPWTDRLQELLNEVLDRGNIETEAGRIPSTSLEVCGELMQTLSRMHWMTGNDDYRRAAYQLADYFLRYHLPIEQDRLSLDDHGCEFISGLSEVYYLAAHKDPDRRRAWRPALHRLLDRILEVGRDPHGLFVMCINPITGEQTNKELTDNWGYNYNAYLVVGELDDVPRYRQAVASALANLPRFNDYPWERDSADGIADSLEGGINLINRIPDPQAITWAHFTARRLLAKQRDTGVIEGWHGDGNFARTALMLALWDSAGAYVTPWRADLKLGAYRDDDGTYHFELRADWPWQGRLHFDRPRHAETLHLPTDYARLNQFPEWFTVAEDAGFASNAGQVTGRQLRQGLDVSVRPEQPYRMTLRKER
ncbi:MAG: hypothetical protein ACC645_14490 [Pirellulales bacterium]